MTGHAQNGQRHPMEKSRELQRRLYLAAKRSGTRRFHALYGRMFRPDVLWRAWVEVRANGGRPGVDGVRIEDVERQGVEAFLRELAEDLKAERYRPRPVLRGGDPEAGWSQAPAGDSDGTRSGGPAGVQERHRAAARGELPAVLAWVPSQAQCGAGGAGGQGGTGPGLGSARCGHRELLRQRGTTRSCGVSCGGA